MKIALIPHPFSTAYKAAAALHVSGPLTRAELFVLIDFGPRVERRDKKIVAFVADGWLTEADGKIGIGALAKSHFSGAKLPAVKLEGAVAGARTSGAYATPPLSRRFIPSSKGFRDDMPAWSERSANFQFHALA